MSPVPLSVANSANATKNMANSSNTHKQQMEQNNNKNKSTDNNSNNKNNCNTSIAKKQSIKADTKMSHDKQNKEMPSTTASSTTTNSSVSSTAFSLSSIANANTSTTAAINAAKNVIVSSQCDSSSISSSSISSISNGDCQQTSSSSSSSSTASCDAVIKTELESIDSASDNAQELNDLSDPNDLQQLAAMRQRPITLSTVNSHIICSLCFGYLIDATTIVECLHSFCHSCLIKHLRTEQYCPRCEMMINTAKPNIKPDTTLQAIVYKLVPGLYEKELMRKRAFYKDRPEDAALATPEQRGDDTEHLIFSPSDYMSISLEYADIEEYMKSNTEYNELLKPRYLKCPAMCTVAHLKKLVYGKFEINSNRFTIDIMYKVKTIVLLDHYTLMDVAYIYTWKRDAPMRFYFRVKQSLRPLIRVKKNLLPQRKKEMTSTTAVAVVAEPKLHSQTTRIVHEPTPAAVAELANRDNKILEPEEIKQENDSEVSSTTEIPTPTPEPHPIEPKQFEIIQPTQSPSVSSHDSSSPTEKLKITLVNKAVKEKTVHSVGDGDVNSCSSTKVKLIKERKENHKTSSPSNSSSSSPTSLPKDERKVENIKLKIDLSKQNSVTIINMSDPERKEIVKPVKPEKEWKVKTKKEKDGSPKSSPKSSPHSERKSKTPSPLTVPPLTIKAERISPLAKSNSPSILEEEDKKSQFLKSFALTPIKGVKIEKVESKPSKNSLKEFTHSIINKMAVKDPLQSSSSSKRKSKEPIKTVVKKPKLSPPLATEDFKIKLPPIVNPRPTQPALAGSNFNSVAPSSSSKTLMPPPAPINSMKPPSSLPKKIHKPSPAKVTAAPPGSLTPHPMHNGNNGIQLAAPGSRTPIAKRFQPILPKTPRINPFANIPSEVNKLLKDAGTEIKTIPKEPVASKVYGPKTDATPSVMGPPPIPAPVSSSNKNQNSQSNNGRNGLNNSSTSSGKPNSGSGNKSNSYLNLALFNAAKSKGNEVPPGCRTPMYTPNSPIYSPSSPQYVPNYNIPTMPTYKYTPKPNSSGNSYLQNVLGATNSQMSSLFPSPPVKKDANSSTNNNNNATSQNSTSANSANNRNEHQAPAKRVYPFARSPSPVEDPPEKQLKVKSLLNSCNINIPSSLSITITREDGETSANGTSYPKHKSPVNNYIEILKLPDQPADNAECMRLSPPIQNTNNSSLFPNPPIRRVATPPSPPAPAAAAAQTATANNGKSTANNTMQSSTATLKPTATNLGANLNLLTKNSSSNNVSNKSPTMMAKLPTNNNSKSPINANDKKTPSPEKRLSSASANNEQKSPNSGGSDNSASKKFRHILPRQITKNIPSDATPTKTTTISSAAGNVIGTYSSPNGVNVKIHSNTKKVQPPKKSPVAQQNSSAANLSKNPQQQSLLNANQNSNSTPVHNGLKATVKSNHIAKNNGKTNANTNSAAANSKLTPTTNITPPPPPPPPTTTLTHPMQAMLPPHLAAAGQAELSKLLKENLLRAQVQAAVANQSNMFYPYAANAAAAAAQLGQFNPTMYNYQQAYIMDQLSRMQRAGNEAFSEYMQKLKNSMDANNKTSAELLLAQQQQQQQHAKTPAAKNLSSPKSLPTSTAHTGQNNNTNNTSTTTTKSLNTTPAGSAALKEHMHSHSHSHQQQQQQNQAAKSK